MKYDIDYEMIKYIDENADSYLSLREILKQNNCSRNEAISKIDCFKADFANLLKRYNIGSKNIFMTCMDLLSLIEDSPDNRDLQYLYNCIITDKGLLNTINSEGNTVEQNICNYFSQTAKIRELTDFLEQQIEYARKICCIKENFGKISDIQSSSAEEVEMLYQLTLQYDFITESTVYRDNFSALLDYINSNEDIKLLKPYLIFSVLTRKHGMIQNRAGFIPNFRAVFNYQEYSIHTDNDKNFNTYQEYIELYEQIKETYADSTEVNIGLCDFCFANTSSLSKWYYVWCKPDIDIPVSFRQKAEQLKSLSFPMLYRYDDYLDIEPYEFETRHRKIYNSWEKYLTEKPEILDDFFHALYSNSLVTEYASKLPHSKDFPLYASNFLYQKAEISLIDIMLDYAELFTKI